MTVDTTQSLEQKAQVLLAPSGLHTFGWFNADGKAGLLVGNIGSSLWSQFYSSSEFNDDEPDGLNRWTVNTLSPVAEQICAEIRFPFGDPVWPFQRYAVEAMGMQQSPIGLLIHPEYGLWTAFRAALIFNIELGQVSKINSVHPCDTCTDKPCLTSCPVSAFTDQGYDYLACKSHVRSDEGADCFTGGCIARHACPVGCKYIYEPEHQAFHMRAFV